MVVASVVVGAAMVVVHLGEERREEGWGCGRLGRVEER